MKVLGIETSCDETAAAVVENGRAIRSNIVVSSLDEHERYGGVIPEIASRRQLDYIYPVAASALKKANLTLKDIDAIAVTASPGLIGSLLVGISFARALSFALNRPLVEVDHIQAHLYANFLHPFGQEKEKEPTLPAIGMVVSGGHTALYYLKNFKDIQLIGQTADDAAGEAFDKVARILEIGYPGGPAIDKLSKECKNTNIRFTCAAFPDTLDFSFSGIKTAVLYYHRDHAHDTGYSKANVAAAFQKSVVETLVSKCLAACRNKKIRTLLIGGGVAANSALRNKLAEMASQENIKTFYPPLSLCMDNAAMIAGLGFHHLKQTPTMQLNKQKPRFSYQP